MGQEGRKRKAGGGHSGGSTGEETEVVLDPSCIHFTFSRIRPVFSCGRTIESTLQQFVRGELSPRDLPLLSVFVSEEEEDGDNVESDDDDSGKKRNKKKQQQQQQQRPQKTEKYFSQNNRRLYLYKQLKAMGLLEVVPVRLRPLPLTHRMAAKYTSKTCSLQAKLMGPQEAKAAGESEDKDGEKPLVNEDEEKKVQESVAA